MLVLSFNVHIKLAGRSSQGIPAISLLSDHKLAIREATRDPRCQVGSLWAVLESSVSRKPLNESILRFGDLIGMMIAIRSSQGWGLNKALPTLLYIT